ncbi:Myo-inositol 2-dehydrogenase [Neomoorella glycerini]|uniref:Myo-inositol 2-dehydrogenase n=1 Tax=Neomoorella glycerini TaxID=55779 RepID=A0A6I5ZSD1_9FIRM|nr:Gfo/Idh/MocA family oxidoreductase [Moorella glycerini]QGP92619.1 Myo-inositol 2-dehydrogenase [Moorella glycerini]
MTLRIGLIGCGAAGQAHAAAYRDLEGVELRAVADADAAAAARLAAAAGGAALSLEELLDTDLDIIDIATPTPTHAALVQEAARRGRDILCETPLARTMDQAQAAVTACREAGVRLIPLHLNAFMPPLRRAAAILTGGSLGRAGVIRITRRRPGVPASTGDWRRSLKESGGVILDLLAQDIAFLIGCCGRVQRVYAASTAYREILAGEYALVSLRMQNGVIAHLDGNWLPGDQGGDELEIAASNGLIAYSEENTAPLRFTTAGGDPGRRVLVSPVDEDMYAAGLREALRSLAGEPTSLAGTEVALHTLEVALAALESAATGQVFTLA